MKKIFKLDKGMTQAISHYSRHADAGKVVKPDGKYKYTGKSNVTAETKIRNFYIATVCSLAAAAAVLFLITNASYWFDERVVELPQSDAEVVKPTHPTPQAPR